ncbi:SH3 domain-containing protein [Rhodohalobacter sp.]|uniref:SH3 domain-containing protein n=1 Tax=Rhodohalobacter sp. TaxID=1974210 RepID=UPI002ACD4992|nr:SH3 domain-containing protein [Rhodohalobacter sp.]MDZ7755690.1 SH3 domain-containing protein [Rhodohalobacter sp.]
MKTLSTALLFLAASLFAPSLAFAQQSNFDRATEELQQQNYREAISQYQQIADNGHHSGALWFNIGIAYTQLDSLGLAKYYFLKSSDYPETKADAKNAIEYVNERFNRRSATLPTLPWERFSNYLNNQVGASSLYSMALTFLYLGIAGILIFWFYGKFRTYSYYAGISSVVMSLLLFITAFYIQYFDSRYGTGVVVEEQSIVYQSPDTSSGEVSTAYEGYTVRVDYHESENQQEWIYIRLENGMKGWIENQAVKAL